jgi:hypothetical protein
MVLNIEARKTRKIKIGKNLQINTFGRSLAIPLGVKYGVTDSYAQTYSLVSLKFE